MKKSPLFIFLSMIFTAFIICGIFSCSNTKNPRTLRGPVLIKIVSGEPRNESLVMIPDKLKMVKAYRGEIIEWEIVAGSNVDLIRLEPKDQQPELFDGPYPGQKYTNSASGKIGPNAKYRKHYKYAIFYKLKNDTTEYYLDPKLVILQ